MKARHDEAQSIVSRLTDQKATLGDQVSELKHLQTEFEEMYELRNDVTIKLEKSLFKVEMD